MLAPVLPEHADHKCCSGRGQTSFTVQAGGRPQQGPAGRVLRASKGVFSEWASRWNVEVLGEPRPEG